MMQDLYGIIGYPLSHSFSKKYFNQKFSSENIDAEYVNFEISKVGDLKAIVREHSNLRGLNVTLPYKVSVIPLLDGLSDNARQIGAVNVIKVKHQASGKVYLEGHNSDIVGFKQSIGPLLGGNHRKALILGTGGASKAVLYGLKQLGLASTLVSRTKRGEGCITYGDITPKIMSEYTVVVNATPVGMYPKTDEYPPIPYECVTPEHVLYDLLYNPDETSFMKKGKVQGATVKNGLEMLLLQAFEAWNIWSR